MKTKKQYPKSAKPPLLVIGKSTWPENNAGPVIAGSCRILNELLKEGFDVINPEDLLDESDKRKILSTVCQISDVLLQAAEEKGFSKTKSDGLANIGVIAAFEQLSREAVYKKLGFDDALISGGIFEYSTAGKEQQKKSGAPGFLEKVIFSPPYSFDFCSRSAKKIKDSKAKRLVRIYLTRVTDRRGMIWLRNLVQIVKWLKPGGRVHYCIFRLESAAPKRLIGDKLIDQLNSIVSPAIVSAICRKVGSYDENIDVADATLSDLLDKIEDKPEEAKFNFLGKAEIDGYCLALNQHAVPTEFMCHGGMVVHGDEERKKITSLYSRAVYNEPEIVTQIISRSPLQVYCSKNKARVVSKVRVVPFDEFGSKTDNKFNIYLAPNFISWFKNHIGISPSCFEANECIRALVGAARGVDNVEVQLRIKTTARDKGRVHSKKLVRGLLPKDFQDLYDPEHGIHDASKGAHSAYMSQSDLVVTEGITAVMFEALENRKPLLLINKSPERTASLPATRITGREKLQQRSAVYSTSAQDDLRQVIAQLRDLHFNKPLTDAELAPYIWVE